MCALPLPGEAPFPSANTLVVDGGSSVPTATEHFRPRRRWPRRPQPTAIGLTIAPMIDMSFTFLIFFVATTRFDRPEGLLASKLPAVGGGTVPALPFSPIVIRVQHTAVGDPGYLLAVDGFADAPTRVVDLPLFLRGIQHQPGFDTTTPVVIVADDDVAWDHVVGCWNGVLRAGYSRIAFAEP